MSEEIQLEYALKESLKLQSHYAYLLNIFDGGKRIQFNTVQEWLDRLNKIKGLEIQESKIEAGPTPINISITDDGFKFGDKLG